MIWVSRLKDANFSLPSATNSNPPLSLEGEETDTLDQM